MWTTDLNNLAHPSHGGGPRAASGAGATYRDSGQNPKFAEPVA